MTVTENPPSGHSHSDEMHAGAARDLSVERGAADDGRPRFDDLYDEHFAFVWRNLRRMGVPESSVADAAQDVFVVVHRRLDQFEGRSSVRTWLFGIVLRVGRDHRRTARRKSPGEPLDESLADPVQPTPLESAERAEAARLLERLLAELDEDQRAVLVLTELEQMSAPEIAQALSVNLNTVYSRLRLARARFEKAARRCRPGRQP